MENKKVSILFFPKEYYPLNRVRLTELYMKEFTNLGNKVTWILLSDTITEKIKKIESGRNKSIILRSKSTDKKLHRFFNMLSKLAKYKIGKRQMELTNVDIIVANDGIIDGFVAYLLSRKYDKPFVYYLSFLFFELDKDAFTEIRRNVDNLFKRIGALVKKRLYIYLIKKCDIFHPISQMMSEYFASYTQGKIVIPLPLCPAKHFRENYSVRKNSENHSYSLIYVGAIGAIRRIDFLIDLLQRIKENESEIQVKLRILGPIPDRDYLRKLQNKAISLGLKKHVEILPGVPISQVPDIIKCSDIGLSFYNPLLAYRTASPTKVVEYLSLGMPVIGNREVEDQKEVIEMSGGGFATRYDINEAAEKVIYLLTNTDKMITMGESGRRWVEANRNYSIMARELDIKYNQLLRNK